ncbi:hypothetical protein [Providencia manganoxydans]|uniref:hypothetical protein n=1 Tax=Providencia manganoxydans TaxID=2923283 RepID=UPI0032DAED1D
MTKGYQGIYGEIRQIVVDEINVLAGANTEKQEIASRIAQRCIDEIHAIPTSPGTIIKLIEQAHNQKAGKTSPKLGVMGRYEQTRKK